MRGRILLAAFLSLSINACSGDVEALPPVADSSSSSEDTSVSTVDSTVTDSAAGDGTGGDATDSGTTDGGADTQVDSATDSGAIDSGTDSGTVDSGADSATADADATLEDASDGG
ncbi:MAG: hypothetical protein ACXWUG_26915 [Polyangiales bacterium]